jgi:hypothetical protein
MIRQRLIIAVFVLAKLLLLGHDMIPHHFHEGDLCPESNSLTDNTHKHGNGNDKDSSGEPCCALGDLQLISNDPRSELNGCFCTAANNKNHHRDCFIHQAENIQPPCSILRTELVDSLNSGLHSQNVNPSVGLRAPPVV